MDRDRLKAYLEQGLSLDQIGAVEGKHASTISYWLGKHGLRANGADRHSPKGAIDRESLTALVQRGLTLSEIGAEVGRSITTVRYWIRRYGLPSPRNVRRAELERAIAEGRRILMQECGKHGWTTFVLENSGRTRCRRCRMEAVSDWRRRTKAKLVAEAGGCCVLCGYDRHQAALHFHHLDPTKKEFHLADMGVTRSIERLRREVEKCVLLCGNCHAEVGAGFTEL
jgi:transposase